MQRLPTYFRLLLVVMSLVYLARLAAYMWSLLSEANGLVHADGFNPVGGDFINLYAAARLVLEGAAGSVYDTITFSAFEKTLLGAFDAIGVWVYPPPSLLFVWPFGLLDYIPALTVWSILGLAVLALGARRAAFRPLEIIVLLLAPATLSGLTIGQTSNLFLGLLLIAISARDGKRPLGGVAAGLLTLKPQLGLALPVIFLLRRQWFAILVAAVIALGLAALSAALFGFDVWRSYLGDTLPFLSEGERSTTGPFMLLEPSVFMSLRIVTGNANLAFLIHGIVALAAIAYAIWRQVTARALDQQAAVALAATAVITPYFHTYDGGLLLCAALLAARHWEAAGGLPRLFAYFVVIGAWILPDLTQILNAAGVPLGPIIMIAVLLLAGEAPRESRALAPAARPATSAP